MNSTIQNAPAALRKFGVAAVLSTSLMLGGCVTTGGVPEAELTPAQIEMRESAQAFNRTVWQGVAAGAVAGALIGALAGGSGNRTEAALIGAAAGGLAGGLAGNYLATKQREYANAEDQIEAVTADMRNKNTQAVAFIEDMEIVIAEHRRSLAELNTGYEAGLVEEAEYRRQLRIVEADQALIADAVASAEKQVETFQETRTLLIAQSGEQKVSEDDFEAYDSELARMVANTERMTALEGDLLETRGV